MTALGGYIGDRILPPFGAKVARHLHATPGGGLQLAYLDCPCRASNGGYSFALTPLPGVGHDVRDHDARAREGWRP